MAPLIRNVLKVYGVESIAINGKIPTAKRDKLVKDFYDDTKGARTAVISGVGGAGLNLSIANSVIFFDQPWSAQEERQIRGRAWRQPQKSPVTGYYLLAEDSADLVMHACARGKGDLFSGFVNEKVAEDLRCIFGGSAFDSAADMMETESAGKKTKKASKPRVVEPELPEDDIQAISEGDTAMQSTDVDPIGDTSSSRHMSEAIELIESDEDGGNKVGRSSRRSVINSDGKTSLPASAFPKLIVDKDEIQFIVEVDQSEMDVEKAEGSANNHEAGVRRTSQALASIEELYPPSPPAAADIPPPKRARQGTIGDDGRAEIMANVAKAADVTKPPSTAST
ncbi:hypothetical protein C0993_007538, partial [Termitomyces sp. T159_Od127]